MNFENCPCKRVKCERYGNCEACLEHHKTVKGTPADCDRIKAKTERKAGRTERKEPK